MSRAIVAAIGVLGFAVAGCGGADRALVTEHHGMGVETRNANPKGEQYEALLKEVERVVNRYHSFQQATRAGYTVKVTDCMAMPGLGGMGFHYGNPALIDAVPDALAPEVLLYAPDRHGSLKFVGLEYVVPYTAWTNPTPPVLFGETFRPNDVFQLWTLHVWLGESNPAGVFADWNPNVRCG